MEDIIVESQKVTKGYSPPWPHDDMLNLQQIGFPQDDEYSLMQGDIYGGSANLDIWYNCEFIQNEVLKHGLKEDGKNITYLLEYVPVLAGTLTGVIRYEGEAIQEFVMTSSGLFNICKDTNYKYKAKAITLNKVTGELKVEYIGDDEFKVDKMEIIVSYEFNLEKTV